MGKTTHGFTDEELELMTEAERQAILDEDTLEIEGVAGEKPDEEDEPAKPDPAAKDATAEGDDAKPDPKQPENPDADDDDAGEDGEDKGEGDDAKPDPKKPDAAAQEEPGDQQDDPPARPKPSSSPRPQYDVPADAKDQLTTFETQLDEIAAKFDDGEMTAAEMRQEQRRIEQQRDDLKERMLKASIAIDNAKANWFERDVPSWLGDHTEYQPGSLRMRMLNDVVKELQVQSDNPFDPDLLDKAHERIQREFGERPANADPDPKPGGKKQAREIPPSLAHVPASDISETEDSGRFAHLDRLADKDPLAYEEALGKMSDAEREAYLQAG